MGQQDAEINPTAGPSETRIQASDIADSVGQIIDRATDGERFIVTRFGRDRAVILAKRDYDDLLRRAAAAA